MGPVAEKVREAGRIGAVAQAIRGPGRSTADADPSDARRLWSRLRDEGRTA